MIHYDAQTILDEIRDQIAEDADQEKLAPLLDLPEDKIDRVFLKQFYAHVGDRFWDQLSDAINDTIAQLWQEYRKEHPTEAEIKAAEIKKKIAELMEQLEKIEGEQQ